MANDRIIGQLRDSLGPDVFESAWSAGSTLSIDRAVADPEPGALAEP